MDSSLRLTVDGIENSAERVLVWANPRQLSEPCLTPLAGIVLRLVHKGRVSLCLDKPLGLSARNRKILGAFVFESPAILIDPSLDQNSPQFRFTMAHELGHLVLHGKLNLRSEDLDNPPGHIEDSRSHFLIGRKPLRTERDWLEWQANRFASAILMPRATVRPAIVDKQEALGVLRNRGKIFVDHQWQNITDYYAIVDYLRAIYQTSRRMILIRLRELKVLQDKRDMREQHITHHIRGLFREETHGAA